LLGHRERAASARPSFDNVTTRQSAHSLKHLQRREDSFFTSLGQVIPRLCKMLLNSRLITDRCERSRKK
jgi:hypothetical protein